MERKLSWKSDLIIRSRSDPVFFIEQVLGSTLWERQRDVCYSVLNNERTAVPASFGVGKCMAYGEPMLLSDGSVVPVETLVDKCFSVLAWDEKTGEQIVADAFAKDNGTREVVRLTTNSGRTIVRTLNHPLWSAYFGLRASTSKIAVQAQFRPIEHLTEDMLVAVPVGLDVTANTAMDASFIKLCGYFLGDGSTTVGLSFTQQEGVVLDEFKELIAEFDCKLSKVKASKYDYCVVGIKHRENKLLEVFRQLNLIGYKAKDKRFPDFIWQADNKSLALLLNRLFACDSWVFVPKGAKGKSTVAITLASEGMIRDIELAMTRLGIYGNVAYGKKRCGDKYFDSWTWQCYRGSEIEKFARIVGIFGKEGKLAAAIEYASKADKAKQLKWPYLNIPKGYVWEKIKSIEYLGVYPTVGICVPEYHTYLTTFVEHNTYLAARLALWWLFCYPKSKVISTAPTQRQVKDLLWAELRTAYHKSNIKLGGELLQLMLKISDDHFAVGFSTDSENMDKFSGYHAPYQMVIFDQAAGIEPLIWEAAEGLMTSEHSRWLTISNTAISSSEMANICMPDRKTRFGKWNVLKIKATESPNVIAGKNVYPGLVAHDWVKRREEAWGRDDPLFKIFVEAEFIPDSEMVVVPFEYITRAFETAGDLGSHIEVGLDVARMGTDSSVWIARSGSKALEGKRMTGNTTMQVVGETVEFKKYLEAKYNQPVLAIKVDVIGLGAGVYDRLMELEEPVVAVNNAEVHSLIDKERYSNIRAEMAWALRHRMEQFGVGLLELHTTDYEIKDYIRGDIQAMRYKITSQGKIQIAQKDEIRKFLGRSPDYWDALVLAYESPGGGPPSVEFMAYDPNANKDMSEAEWKVLLGLSVPIDHESFDEYFS